MSRPCITCGGPLDTSGLTPPRARAASVCAACVRASMASERPDWLGLAVLLVLVVLAAFAFAGCGLVFGGWLAQ